MSDKQDITVSGTTPLGLLGVAFVVLKLLGFVTWSWWWVLAPFWAPVAIGIAEARTAYQRRKRS